MSPALPANQTSVLWRPELDTGAVVLAPSPETLPAPLPAEPFVQAGAWFQPHSDTNDLVIRLANGEALHLVPPTPLAQGDITVAVIPLTIDGFGRVEALLRLLASLHGRAIPPDTRMTRQQITRARRMLQAVDASLSGASRREIAEAIFRLGRLSRDEWQSAPERFAVMDLIHDGLAMVAGGYRKLLRHRRKR